MSCDPYAWNELVVKRRFVVETEALAIVADGMHAGGHINVTARAQRRTWRLPFGVVDRIGGILCKGMENVRKQQFLVLLLVV